MGNYNFVKEIPFRNIFKETNHRLYYIFANTEMPCLTNRALDFAHQTTKKFRLIQTESRCRRQITCLYPFANEKY